MSIYDIEVENPSGERYLLDEYKGKVLVIVNTATKCGLRGQFDDLEKLYQKHKEQDVVVLGFPSNQFANQEPGSSEEAAETCRLDFGVTFPMHAKIKVNGKDAHPLFQHLKDAQKGFLSKEIKWNFTKFVVDQNGEVVERFGPKDSVDEVEKKVSELVS
ncbi:glutathione peroxidase [Halalkalibacillus halophilus]|uniref:glutathione peroxidase n=1 Tax=Halalkalibacillus halophilus TaxID=392827 RepID=UPI00041EA81C|nr:glutathione peroxidase [Halalkalibacillus halophilus]